MALVVFDTDDIQDARFLAENCVYAMGWNDAIDTILEKNPILDLSKYKTNSATDCFTAIQHLKEAIKCKKES